MRVALAVTVALALVAGEARAQVEPPAPESTSGVFVLELDADTRVTADNDLTDHVLSLSFWRQDRPLATQLRGLQVEGLRSFTLVPGTVSGERLDLQLDPSVKSASVVRRGRTRLEITLSDQLYAGAAVRLRAAKDATVAPLEGEDAHLAEILAEPLVEPARFVHLAPFWFSLGTDSPLREPIGREPRPRTWGFVPPVIRDAWRAHADVAEAISQAEQGAPKAAARALHGFDTPDDATRVLLALARGWVWAQPLDNAGPADDGLAAEAFQLAAALAPDAPWEPWARGRAGYHYERQRQWDEALIHYRRAIQGAPDHRERPYWELGVGMSLLGRGRTAEGLEQLTTSLGQIPLEDDLNRFEARLAVLFALHRTGDPARAARVLDLLLEQHPVQANHPSWMVPWSLILLDAGRPAQAIPWLERMETTSKRRVRREHARWWRQEAALATGDLKEARLGLRRILEQTPGSALVPLAKLRLRLLDLLATEPDKRETTWPELGVTLRELAQEWPFTVLEDEALSLAAQVFLDSGLLGDGLSLYSWVEKRTPSIGGATAYETVVCRFAPINFQELRAAGEHVAALGVWTEFLDTPQMQACVDPRARAEAVATALTAGLPDLALRWLGRSVAEGRGGADDAANLTEMAGVYLREGRPEAARRTLDFIENSDLPKDRGQLAAAWGDLAVVEGEHAQAVKRYDEAIRHAGTTVRSRASIPSLRYRRGLARHAAKLPDAEPDLVFGLEEGGTEDLGGGWLRVAGMRQVRAEEGSDARWTPKTPAARAVWDTVLEAATQAEAHASTPDQERAASWHRASALLALGQDDEALALLEQLEQSQDAWGLLARQRKGSLGFERTLDDETVKVP